MRTTLIKPFGYDIFTRGQLTYIMDINVPMELEGARIVQLAGTELQKKSTYR